MDRTFHSIPKHTAPMVAGLLWAAPAPAQDTTIQVDPDRPRVTFSAERGWYDAPLTLILEASDPDDSISYTLDGTAPFEVATRYDGPIPIDRPMVVKATATDGEGVFSPVTAHTYLFLDDVLTQADLPPGHPEAWAGYRADYGMDPDIVGPDRDGVIAGLMHLPVVSVSVGREQLFHPDVGIYSNATEDGPAWERRASLEWFHPDDPDDSWQVSGRSPRRHRCLRWRRKPPASVERRAIRRPSRRAR